MRLQLRTFRRMPRRNDLWALPSTDIESEPIYGIEIRIQW